MLFWRAQRRQECWEQSSAGALLLYELLRLRFITSTPLDTVRGSGTFAGIQCLLDAIRNRDVQVQLDAPWIHLPVYTLERILFNQTLRRAGNCDATIGFDLDGYRLARHRGVAHVAALKGVIADELRFESGMTQATMRVQARFEAAHVRSADVVLATSRYSARMARDAYGLSEPPRIVPELIDLSGWRRALDANPAEPDRSRFTVLTVARFYRRKRLTHLLQAVAQLRSRIPDLEMRVVGNGPERARLLNLCQQLNLGPIVRFLGDVSRAELASEYNRCDLFCLPSVQEGFGIVFLEAMAAGKPIVAARAAAVPEVVPHGILVEPDNAEALAGGIEQVYRDPELRTRLGVTGLQWVEQFDAPRVAGLFLDEVRRVRGVAAARSASG